ncbi:hypothetical protein WH96_06590 [Kiloniella spongiae]|uniref:Uncharacterized protein n=2 Tax=Kiloniella spongiae TaxID=1489064 RepID=A0A0H2MFH4_9PROT|nr:hypothetical protein WH96_06590 [Kiloniella spongiae]
MTFGDTVETENEVVEAKESNPDAGFLTEDEFYDALHGGLEFAGWYTKLETLPIQDFEAEKARKATDALYKLCLKVKWLQFLIHPGNEYAQAAIAIGSFTIPKAMMVIAEIKAKNAKPVKQSSQKTEQPVQQSAQSGGDDPYDFGPNDGSAANG